MDRAEEELRQDLSNLSAKHAGKITSVRFAANLIGVCGLVLSKIPGNKADKLAIYDELTKSVRDKVRGRRMNRVQKKNTSTEAQKEQRCERS